MPRSYGVKSLLLGVLIGLFFQAGYAQDHPLVIGYERFHSETPTFEGGRILFNELGCVNCHDNPTDLPARKGPNLLDIAHRGDPNWLRAFLIHPAEAKPGTTMPQMHLTKEDAETVLHYLVSLRSPKKPSKAFKFVNAERGISLYHEFGCVACHTPSEDFYPPEGKPDANAYSYPSIPLVELDKRYDIHSLSAFLYEPHAYWPEGRMPKFKLDREDGGDLAAFLLDYQNGDSTDYPPFPKWVVDREASIRGKAIVEEKNCMACHVLPDERSFPLKLPRNSQTPQSVSNRHPVYSLSSRQLASIVLFLTEESQAAPAISHLHTHNCLACHSRNGEGGPDQDRSIYFVGDHDLGDTGRLPPPLTKIERKLRPEWLSDALEGTQTVRPYLRTQMPVFGDSLHGLVEYLIDEDQEPIKTIELSEGNLEAGRQLLGTQGGLNCITCHNWGDRRSIGIQALDISNMAERLTFNWLHDYLIDPASHRPNTLMPSFWPGGVASNTSILDGTTDAQISAIYAFSKYGDGLPEGFPDENSREYEIVPTDRPVIQRSFMEGIGTNVILVGFPEGINLAFDGSNGTPAMLWKGRFYDAYRTWFSRFPEFEKPLGTEIVHWAESNQKSLPRYRGYRIDASGNPEFLLSVNDSELVECYEAILTENGASALQRTIRYSNAKQRDASEPIHPKAVQTTETTTQDALTRNFIYRW